MLGFPVDQTFQHLQDKCPFVGLRARTLLGAPGLTSSNKKLLGAPGLTSSNKKLLGAPGLTSSNKKLLGAPGRTTRSDRTLLFVIHKRRVLRTIGLRR